ncbi:hypothetical protein FB45DRAFT_862997 [Roridomyces roridus]|uniref:Uncharacterized protein n=1 Tax=Roridomyces roridus TaxID=1738132 RepID=A0AAD7C8G5_9AGAR|nr:hypothetical protein FB45DRAFT_862997 [Roridomyces roridus]
MDQCPVTFDNDEYDARGMVVQDLARVGVGIGFRLGLGSFLLANGSHHIVSATALHQRRRPLSEALRVLPAATSIRTYWSRAEDSVEMRSLQFTILDDESEPVPTLFNVGHTDPPEPAGALLYDPRHSIDLAHGFFGDLTHLEILRGGGARDLWGIGMGGLQNLTDLAFNDRVSAAHDHLSGAADVGWEMSRRGMLIVRVFL